MKTIEINLYEFKELSKKAKQKAINTWYENEDYPFLQENLTERCYDLLKEQGINFSDINLLYSLGYSQGDGLCFTGTLERNGFKLVLTHSYRYYFANSVTMDFYDSDGEEIDENSGLKAIYFEVCKQLEKEGYSELEYRMTDEEFSEHCESNNYTFESDGTMNNG